MTPKSALTAKIERERESRLESKCGLPKRLRSTAATAALAKKNPSSSLLTVSIQRSNNDNNNHLTTPRCCSLYYLPPTLCSPSFFLFIIFLCLAWAFFLLTLALQLNKYWVENVFALRKYCKYVSFCLSYSRRRRQQRCPSLFSAAFAFLCTGETRLLDMS